MAKIVLAGPANDPFLPRCELLADQLKTSLPNFEVNKVFVQPSEWDDWLQNTCSKFGWNRNQIKGPIVWRELVSRGGKATLIGDSNDFQEFCRTYYGVRGNQPTPYLLKVASENMSWTDIRDSEQQQWVDCQKPVVVTVWNAVADAAQLIIGKIAQGGVLPYDDIEIRLAAAPWIIPVAAQLANDDSAQTRPTSQQGNGGAYSSRASVAGDTSSILQHLNLLETIQADIEDMACGSVRRVLNCGGNAITASIGSKLIVIVIDETCNNDFSLDSFRALGRDLENTLKSMTEQTDQTRNTFLLPDTSTRILFVPCNADCINKTLFSAAENLVAGILSTASEDPDGSFPLDYETVKKHSFCIDPARVLCLTTPLENAAKSLVSKQLQVTTPYIHNLIIWSKPEPEQPMPQGAQVPWPFYVDVTQAAVAEHRGTIEGPAPYTRQVMELIIHEKKFLQGLNETVASRYVSSTGKSLSLTSAATDFLRGWFGGAEKHPNIYVELHRRSLVYSVGACKFSLPPHIADPVSPHAQSSQTHQVLQGATITASESDEPQPSASAIAPLESAKTEQLQAPLVSSSFKSVPIRFTGRDDLQGNGYLVAEDFRPPNEMFPAPKEIKNVAGEELIPDENQVEAEPPKETIPLAEDGTFGDDGVAAAMAGELNNETDLIGGDGEDQTI